MPKRSLLLLAVTLLWVLAGCGASSSSADPAPSRASSTVRSTPSTAMPNLSAAKPKDDRAVRADLSSALTAENNVYLRTLAFSDDINEMRALEPTLDWGNGLQLRVSADGSAACVSEQTERGVTLAHAIVITDDDAAVYFGDAGIECPERPTAAGFAAPGWTRGVERAS